jgi:hypothetical protein
MRNNRLNAYMWTHASTSLDDISLEILARPEIDKGLCTQRHAELSLLLSGINCNGTKTNSSRILKSEMT